MKVTLSKIGQAIGMLYLSIVGLYDLYFCYLWVIPQNASTEFIPVILRLFELSVYGWIWTTLKALVWPLYAFGIL